MKKQNNNWVIFVLSLLSLVGGTSSMLAQQNTTVKQNEIRDKAYETINKGYDAYATVKDEDALYDFLRLFVDEEVPVYNDLLGISAKRVLPVGDYARLLADNSIRLKRVSIKNVQMVGDLKNVDGQWQVDISFDKEMSYYNGCGIYFSSREFYEADYHLTATLVYDDFDEKCRISRIDGSIASNNVLPLDYAVIQQNSPRDLMLRYHQEPLKYNSNNQAILPGMYDRHGFSHPKFDASRLSPRIDGCDIVTMNYLKSPDVMRLKPHVGFGLGNAMSIEGDSAMNSTSSSSFNFGVDFGYKFFENGPISLSANVGLGLSSSSLKLGYQSAEYMTTQGADIDGDTYKRYYENLSLKQTVKFTDLTISLYIDAEVELASSFALYASIGARFNFNMSAKVDKVSGSSGKVYGVHSYLNKGKTIDVTLDESWGYNGYAKDVNFADAESDELKGVNGMTMDFTGNIGVRYSIPNTPFAVDLGMSYLMGLNDMMKVDKAETEKPVVYNTVTISNGDFTSTEHVNLPSQIESLKRQSLQLNIGLVYKF